ncbi:MAG: glycine cleavage system protein GcvH [Candidatus Latescibacteria bacterium]|nr:glycine cleavage system protein GcvH [Candidatus Latescibacterota bacterium]
MVASDRKYTKDHEWVLAEGEIATVGVTEYAAHELGDVVFLELPEVGTVVGQGETVGTIETVKSVEDLFSPVGGEVVAVNEAVLDAPETVNQDPLEAGWLYKVRIGDRSELDELLTADDYDALIGG